MVAKMLLPTLGGSPSVWNTAMVFFQSVLVLGYGLAHAGMRHLGPRAQRRLQVVALASPLLVLPVGLPGWSPPTGGSPVLWTLGALAVSVGAPFLLLSTCSPTLQHWFATSEATSGRDPYFLYAAGNVGSLLALLAYPFLIEPHVTLDGQARMFTVGYVVLVVLSAGCALRRVAPTATGPAAATPSGPPVTWAQRSRWLVWAAVPSALLLGVTRHLSTDVMSMPMLWIAPLALYLLTFVVAFGRPADRLVPRAGVALLVSVVALVVSIGTGPWSLAAMVALHLAVFTAAALLGHARLAATKPDASRLTEFYLTTSVGGAIGGAVTTLVAPLVFPTVIEYPLAIAAAVAMVPPAVVARRGGRVVTPATLASTLALLAAAVAVTHGPAGAGALLAIVALAGAAVVARRVADTSVGVALALGLVVALSVLPSPQDLTTDRSFFGVTTVSVSPDGEHLLMSGTTLHGRQDPDEPGTPMSYYHPAGPLGRLMDASPPGPRAVGVVGLGAGSLAAYGRAGDAYTFYEIDPVVIDIAQDPRYFTFLSDTAADVDVVVGDGRLNLERTDATYDVLVLDAFSSDSIPLHLLTAEALDAYVDHLAPGGVLAVHISNRYFDLEPGLARLAHDRGLVGVVGDHTPTAEEADHGDEPQRWVFIARDDRPLTGLADDRDVHPLDPDGRGPRWTDDFSDVLSALDPA